MELSEKLVKLMFKFIDESKNLKSFECKSSTYQCFDKDHNTISIELEYNTLEPSIKPSKLSSPKPVIRFKDLKSYITKGEYDEIVYRVKSKISEFEKIEKEIELKRQEKLVDRLLNN